MLRRLGIEATARRVAAGVILGLSLLGCPSRASAQSVPDAPATTPVATASPAATGSPENQGTDDLLMPSLPPSVAASVTATAAPPALSATSLASYMASRRRERKAAGETSEPLDVDIDPNAVRAAKRVAVAGFHFMIWPYLLSLVGGSAVSQCATCGPDHKDFGLLAIPIVGPFLPFATGAQMSETAKGVLIADGVLQVVGLTLVMGSLAFSPKLQKKAPGPRAAGLTLQFSPVVSPSGGGFGVTGSF